MKEKVLIPTRGVIALDIINSLNSMGMETLLMHSPEDSLSLPVKLADRSYKFYSSRLEDSYLDGEAILEKAREVRADYIHPGYGFLAENPDFARLCRESNIRFIGPEARVLAAVEDKINLRETAAALGLPVLKFSELIRSPLDCEACDDGFTYPLIIKPLKGSGGRGIRVADYRRDAQEQAANLLKREENARSGIFFEEFRPYAHHIEIPFFRDVKDNILFLPEIESSIQRRFQKIFQESPSPNIDERMRTCLYERSQALLRKIDYVGLGYVEFIVENNECLFSEINPTFQINTLISEVHLTSNFLKKQVVISRGELLHDVHGVRIVKPRHHVLLVSLMAEDPYKNFLPSSGQINHFFHYSTIRNVFKTTLYTGARVTPMYDPFIGKILTYAVERPNAINDMRIFLENIIIRGIRTNLVFLKHLLENADLRSGDTIIDFLHLKFDFSKLKNTEEQSLIAAALLAAGFHIDNRKKNYKAKLEKMKQPGLLKRLFSSY
jgi:acetyl/propionyl-CoA carboxylase alpha subunit